MPESRPVIRIAAAVALIVLSSPIPAIPQARQPMPDEAVQNLVRAALLAHFDPASILEIQVLGSALEGDVLSIDTLVVHGRPASFGGFRGEVMGHFADVRLEMPALAARQIRLVRPARATVVARVTASAVEEGLAKSSTTVLRPSVRFWEGQMEIAATIRSGDRLYPAQVRAVLTVEGKQRINAVVSYALVHGASVPQGLI
ncbi:MAG: hypothetical protein FJX73_11945, partial [Armatimonadetes bacterium]|nr:hypothetical protein [Armatimonadota bacterium]